MRHNYSIMLALVTACAVSGAGSQAYAQSYTVTNLGTPLGGTFAQGSGVNNSTGLVSGYANLKGDVDQRAVIFSTHSLTNLGTFGGKNSALLGGFSGFSESKVLAPNNEDFCHTGSHQVCNALSFWNHYHERLPTLGGPSATAYGDDAINIVAGAAETTKVDAGCKADPSLGFYRQFLPVVWASGRVQALPVASGDTVGEAFAVNVSGEVVGSSGTCANNYEHMLLWRNGNKTRLGTLGGSLYNAPSGINKAGEITGGSDLPGDLTGDAFLWKNGVLQDLGRLKGDFFSFGTAINDLGQIVGQSCDANFNCRAILWQNGKMVDLNTLIPAHSALYLLGANAIDNKGVIVGYAFDAATQTTPAFKAVLTPKATANLVLEQSVEEVPHVSAPDSSRFLAKQISRHTSLRNPR